MEIVEVDMAAEGIEVEEVSQAEAEGHFHLEGQEPHEETFYLDQSQLMQVTERYHRATAAKTVVEAAAQAFHGMNAELQRYLEKLLLDFGIPNTAKMGFDIPNAKMTCTWTGDKTNGRVSFGNFPAPAGKEPGLFTVIDPKDPDLSTKLRAKAEKELARQRASQ